MCRHGFADGLPGTKETMLSQQKIDNLADSVLGVLGQHPNFRNFVNSVRPGFWDEIVPLNAPPKVAATEVLRIAGERGWLGDLLEPLADRFPSRGEFSDALAELKSSSIPPNIPDLETDAHQGRMRRVLAGIGILGAAIASSAAITGQLTTVWHGITALLPDSPPHISIVSVPYVHFRPRAKPPADPSAAGADPSWTYSPLTITVPLSYLDQSKSDSQAVITSSAISLHWGNRAIDYHSAYVVRFLDDGPCEKDWLCRIGIDRPENVKNGQATELKETLFLPASDDSLSWRDFIDTVISRSGPSSLEIVVSAKINLPDAPPVSISDQCTIDMNAYRTQFEKEFVAGRDPRPVFWQPNCS